ncbi:hypothetical protein [Acinetobacter sp. ANC 3813]|uniref:hypothetical protein n=1 Tax=Acinetobacter sp. ANC 3813 TaxID=1977873 RepID=UPI000A332F99|nr:hypothetical protein [Acinetobacter sp. ANC 3813]OTG91849.1 hypothetical protein B9T34_00410 [Acinetobacter sp. ANC 3813]
MKLFTLSSLSMLAFSASSYSLAADEDCAINRTKWSAGFNKVYQLDEFYVYYSDLPNNPNTPVDTRDINKNKVPDVIENIAIQAQASRDAFSLAGLRHPLKSPRYQHVKAIAIYVQKLSGNGIAYEVAAKHSAIPAIKNMPCSLPMSISNSIPDFPGAYWTTVTHELFHLYQYGYSQFKNKWYLESMANWAERALRVDINTQTQRLEALPQNTKQLQKQIFDKDYNPMWRRLFYIDQSDVLKLPVQLTSRKYINGEAVFKDQVWYGTGFALKFLQDLERSSNAISKQLKWPAYEWKEPNQKLNEWNCTIFQIYQKNLQAMPVDLKETAAMRKISKRELKPLCQ